MTDQRYCVECGKELSPGDRFCPACGATIREDEYWADVPEGAVVATASVEDRSGTLKNVEILTILWAVAAIFMGICCLACMGMVDEMIEELQNTEYEGYASAWDYLVSQGFDRETFMMMFGIIGGVLMASGIFAAVSAYFDHTRKHYTVSMVCLVLSIVFSGMGLFSLIIGIVVAVYLSKCKCEFVS